MITDITCTLNVTADGAVRMYDEIQMSSRYRMENPKQQHAASVTAEIADVNLRVVYAR